MSNVYHTEPPTLGKVVFHTSYGDVDVELWSKECPKACRNFVQLCLEGYYDRTTFHRIIPGFMAQGGDPTGTGEGGESIWGKPFRDEPSPRIRFNHRGQLAMANENAPDTNRAQFFFSLDECKWLDGKHTIFGTVAGQTVFNLLRMGEAQVDANDRPVDDIVILNIEVLVNPFDDIVPRLSVAKPLDKPKPKRKAVGDRKLLSFGDEEEDEGAEPARMVAAPAAVPEAAPRRKNDDSASDDGGAAPLRAADSQDAPLESDSEDDVGPSFSEKVREAAAAGPKKSRAADAKDFGDRMAAQLRARKARVAEREHKDNERAKASRREAHEDHGEFAAAVVPDAELETALTKKRREADTAKEALRLAERESKKLEKKRAEAAEARKLIKSSAVAPTRLGADAVQEDLDQATTDLLSDFESLRKRHMQKSKSTRGREAETLARLASFKSKLSTTKVMPRNVLEKRRFGKETEAPQPRPVLAPLCDRGICSSTRVSFDKGPRALCPHGAFVRPLSGMLSMPDPSHHLLLLGGWARGRQGATRTACGGRAAVTRLSKVAATDSPRGMETVLARSRTTLF
mmetsp:Transcript_1497/g.5360  ORF Transcript_1497/g.5360 Transcript_1497/m.5360 type:complete len:572 (-) Transcript_1497:748-2463(-)